jgi:hypothetical protein
VVEPGASLLNSTLTSASFSQECVAENDVCSGPGLQTQSCCGGFECQKLLGGDQSKCIQRQPQCVAENAICSGPGLQTQACCGDMACEKLLGGAHSKCIRRQPVRVNNGDICGGPGQLTQPCCGESACQAAFGGNGQMHCVARTAAVLRGSLGAANIGTAFPLRNESSEGNETADAIQGQEVVAVGKIQP